MSDRQEDVGRSSMTKLCKMTVCSDGTLGLHLSRAPWDPYPWVSGIQEDSAAYFAGVRNGDVLLEVNGIDVLGQKISEVAKMIRKPWDTGETHVNFLVWSHRIDQNNINQQSLQKFATCLQNVAQLLECPVCLEVVKPPGWQCCNGHVLCNSCRGRTTKCPVCRVALGPRGRCLLSDKLFTLLAETFPCDVNKRTDSKLSSHDVKQNNGISASKNAVLDRKQIISKICEKAPHRTHISVARIENKIYHCPIGKSCTKTGTGKSETESCNLFNQWDILTHIQRHHDVPVNQYYGNFGELILIELMVNSVCCITLRPVKSTCSSNSTENTASTITPPSETLPTSYVDVKEFQQDSFFIAQIPLNENEPEQVGDDTVDVRNTNNAVFLWHCGNDQDAKKFQAKIECIEPKLKWKGRVHSLTESWNSIKRRRDFMSIANETLKYLEIVIKLK